MISGALLLNRDYPSIGDFLKRRFTRIIYPCILWTILISLTHLYFHKYYSFMGCIYWKFICNVVFLDVNWNLSSIPILNVFIEKYSDKGCEYFLAIWFIFIILNTFNLYPLFPYFKLDWFSGFIGYPVLGYYLANKKFKYNNSEMWKIGLIILIVSMNICLYCTYFYSPFDSMIFTYQNILIVTMSIGMFLFIKYLDECNKFSSIKDNFIGKIITSISLYSYGMYFSHVIVIQFLIRVNPHSTLLFPLMFILIIFLSWLLPYIISKIPHMKKFSGA